MKAKELAKILLENPEFEVDFSFFGDCIVGENIMPELKRFNISGIDDIGFSDEVIILGGEEK